MKQQFLSDENEREEAKSFFLETFGLGEMRTLRISVGPYKDPAFDLELERYLSSKLKILESKTIETGLIFKSRRSEYVTSPIIISEQAMSMLSNVYYDVILAFDVKVEIIAVH